MGAGFEAYSWSQGGGEIKGVGGRMANGTLKDPVCGEFVHNRILDKNKIAWSITFHAEAGSQQCVSLKIMIGFST